MQVDVRIAMDGDTFVGLRANKDLNEFPYWPALHFSMKQSHIENKGGRVVIKVLSNECLKQAI